MPGAVRHIAHAGNNIGHVPRKATLSHTLVSDRCAARAHNNALHNRWGTTTTRPHRSQHLARTCWSAPTHFALVVVPHVAMPPKKKMAKKTRQAAAEVAPAAAATTAAAAAAGPVLGGAVVGLNADVWLKHRTNVEMVLRHKIFKNVADDAPIDICTHANGQEESGYQAVYHAAKAMRALSRTKTYMCAINLLWVDLYFTTSSNIPIQWSTVKELQNYYFRAPAGFVQMPIEIAVTEAQVQSKDYGEPGTWKRVSSEEIIMAWFTAVASDIVDGKSEDILREWLTHLLTTPATFYCVQADIAWFAEQRRENFSTNTTLARTTVQRIFDLNNRRAQLGSKATPQQVLQLYAANLKTGERSEAITLSFCEKAFTIWDRALNKPAIQKVVLMQEAYRHDSLFTHSTKMNLIISKARTDENIEFVFQLLHDYFLAGLITKDALGTQALEGKQCGCNGKGLVDLWVYKRTMKNYLLDELMPRRNIPQMCKTAIREVTHDFDTFRNKVGMKHATQLPDLSWKAGWPRSADLMLQLVEDCSRIVYVRCLLR